MVLLAPLYSKQFPYRMYSPRLSPTDIYTPCCVRRINAKMLYLKDNKGGEKNGHHL